MKLIDRYIRSSKEAERAEAADRLAEAFAQRAAEHDRSGSFPFDNFADLKEAGFLKLTVPQAFGGDEISLHELVAVQERLARGDGSTTLALGWHLGQMLHLRTTRQWPEPVFEKLCRAVVEGGAMINTFASEAGSGSPSRGGRPETTAVRTKGGYLISGHKTFSTLSPILDRFVVTAHVPEENRNREFLVHAGPGTRVIETWDTIGMRATGSHDVVLENAFSSDEDALIPPGGEAAPPLLDDGGGYLLHIPACYMGIALAARDFALQFARSHRPNHLQGSIADLPLVQQQIGSMEALVRSARSLLYEAADQWDREPESRPFMKPELGLAKYTVTNNALQIVDLAMRIVGGAGLSRSFPLERYYRDVRAGLHNPPMDNTVLQLLAQRALSEAEE